MARRLTWFIGDIHGCLDALLRLEDALVTFSTREGFEPFLVAVGDLIDRGPDSAGVLQHFRRGAERGTHTALLGNHEEMMLRTLGHHAPWVFDEVPFSPWVTTGDRYRASRPTSRWLSEHDFFELTRLMWLSQGGGPTLESWQVDPSRTETWDLPPEDIAFLAALPLVWADEDAVATHALTTASDLAVLLHADGVDQAGSGPVQRALWLRQLPAGPVDDRVHVSGHTPLRRVRRYTDRKLVRVDTGCFLGHRLSAYCPKLDRSLSVPAIVG